MTQHTPKPVTQEDLDRCTRLLDLNKGREEVFYKVQSERDPDTEYEVRAVRKEGRTYLTCTCPAGQDGAASCKHRRWAKAHADLYKQFQQRMQAPIEIVESYPIPKSATVLYTLEQAGTRYEVLRYGNGCLTCNCKAFWEESGPSRLTPHRCVHTDHLQQHLQAALEETAKYLHEIATAR
jgi:hypothetical protein